MTDPSGNDTISIDPADSIVYSKLTPHQPSHLLIEKLLLTDTGSLREEQQLKEVKVASTTIKPSKEVLRSSLKLLLGAVFSHCLQPSKE